MLGFPHVVALLQPYNRCMVLFSKLYSKLWLLKVKLAFIYILTFTEEKKAKKQTLE